MKIGIALLIALGGCASTEQRRQEAVDLIARPEAGDAGARGDPRVRAAFELGQLQAAKSLHAALQRTQDNDAVHSGPDARLVPLTIPERTVDGVILNPGVEYVRLPH